jgi:hypothetical protein
VGLRGGRRGRPGRLLPRRPGRVRLPHADRTWPGRRASH